MKTILDSLPLVKCCMCPRMMKAPWGRVALGWVCSLACQKKYDREHPYIGTEPD